MDDITELERRILYALERIGKGLERLPADAAATGMPVDAEVLRAELEAERATNAQFAERVRMIKEKQETVVSALEKKAARMGEQLDQLTADLDRQRRLNSDLARVNRRLADEARVGLIDSQTIDEAMAAEVEAMRAERASEMAEMAGILAELKPLIGEVSQ